MANRQAEQLFGRAAARPRPAVPATSRSPTGRSSCARHIEQAQAERRAGAGHATSSWPRRGDEPPYLDVQVAPAGRRHGEVARRHASSSTTSPGYRQLQDELEHANRQLETAYEELQSTNEELETTNEELQSTVEELETTNEELQSTNEELETMNEELQSTNDELQTINDELRDRTGELDAAQRVPGGDPRPACAPASSCVDRELQRAGRGTGRPRTCGGCGRTRRSGQHFLNLDIGLPVDQLRQPIRRTLAGEDGPQRELIVDAVNRRGRPVGVRVTTTPMRARRATGRPASSS